MIPNDVIKRMLLDYMEGEAQSEILLLQPDGLAFNSYDIGEFFQDLLKKFSHKKDEEGRKMEYMSRKHARMPGNITLIVFITMTTQNPHKPTDYRRMMK